MSFPGALPTKRRLPDKPRASVKAFFARGESTTASRGEGAALTRGPIVKLEFHFRPANS
jgi:hypothetical protein